MVVVVLLMVEGRAKDEDEGRGMLALHCTYSMYMEARRDARHKSITYKYWMYLRYKQQAVLTASMDSTLFGSRRRGHDVMCVCGSARPLKVWGPCQSMPGGGKGTGRILGREGVTEAARTLRVQGSGWV